VSGGAANVRQRLNFEIDTRGTSSQASPIS
jgi:hypothetical protein